MRILIYIVLFSCFTSFSCSDTNNDWTILFDGSDLNQWHKKGGNAHYEIVGDELVGTAVMNSPNTFMCTKKSYADFILELEVFLPNPLNSGIQFRSQVNEKGIVSGYQCEIDPSNRKFTGGIYDESRRGWLYPLSRNKTAQNAFGMGEWNTFRIECLGPELRIYVNNTLCSSLFDRESAKGIIGLQVHGIGKEEQVGYQVKWRNIKILENDVEANRIPLNKDVEQLVYAPNELSNWEEENGWTLLFDGESLDQWESIHAPKSSLNWTVEDGNLVLDPALKGGDLVTKKAFQNFELQLEFNIAKSGNSGIKYFIQSDKNDQISSIGAEFQILDDQNHPDAKLGKGGNRTVASLYDLIPADNFTTPDRGKQFKGVNRWNHARILVRDGKVEHWLNNELALAYDRHSESFKALVQKSKFVNELEFAQADQGRILLQDHEDQVSFRSIKIRELK